MKKTIIEAYNELMKVNVNGADVEHMYNALVKLTNAIRVMQEENNEEDTDEHVE